MAFLNSDYLRRSEDAKNYEAWQAVFPRSTMVLFSKTTCSPLAALVFHPKDPNVKSLVTAVPETVSESIPHFQGMFDQDNKVFYFTIINLAQEGSINFNILHAPNYKVNCVDPGPSYGINQVNELRPGDDYTIKCDQRNNCEMILKGKTKKDEKTGETVAVTVDAEQKSGGNTLSFYLSVVANISSDELVNLFREGTYWKATSFFIRPNLRKGWMAKGMGAARSLPRMDMEMALSFNETINFGSPSLHETMNADEVTTEPVKKRAKKGASASALAREVPAARGMKRGEQKMLVTHQPVDIGQTQATELDYGEKVQVRSGITGFEYAYDFPSEPTSISLSLWPGMQLLSLDGLETIIQEELQEWEQDHVKKLVAYLPGKFKSEACIIDLEEEPTMVICSCGHQCFCKEDAALYSKSKTTCPICRGPIHAIVDVAELAE